MKGVLYIIIMLLSGCGTTGYMFAGAGYSSPTGPYRNIHTEGATGTYGAGVKFNDYFRCEFRHRSMVNKRPELITNDSTCEVTVGFWGYE